MIRSTMLLMMAMATPLAGFSFESEKQDFIDPLIDHYIAGTAFGVRHYVPKQIDCQSLRIVSDSLSSIPEDKIPYLYTSAVHRLGNYCNTDDWSDVDITVEFNVLGHRVSNFTLRYRPGANRLKGEAYLSLDGYKSPAASIEQVGVFYQWWQDGGELPRGHEKSLRGDALADYLVALATDKQFGRSSPRKDVLFDNWGRGLTHIVDDGMLAQAATLGQPDAILLISKQQAPGIGSVGYERGGYLDTRIEKFEDKSGMVQRVNSLLQLSLLDAVLYSRYLETLGFNLAAPEYEPDLAALPPVLSRSVKLVYDSCNWTGSSAEKLVSLCECITRESAGVVDQLSGPALTLYHSLVAFPPTYPFEIARIEGALRQQSWSQKDILNGTLKAQASLAKVFSGCIVH